jgi:hypothetical protein
VETEFLGTRRGGGGFQPGTSASRIDRAVFTLERSSPAKIPFAARKGSLYFLETA